MQPISPIRLRVIRSARDRVQTAPPAWDRDCRCCLALDHADFDAYRQRTARRSYSLKAGDQAITMRDQEIHSDHSDAEICCFLDWADAHR